MVDHAVNQVILIPDERGVVPGEVDDPNSVDIDLRVLVDHRKE